jgi:N-acetylmuramoyl-L-alanine amidase
MFVRYFTLLLLLAAPAPAAAAAPASVQGIELRTAATGAELSLTISGYGHHTVFLLDKPERVVIDLANTRLAPGVRLPPAGDAVQQVRSGQQPGETLRLVLQLTQRLSLQEHLSVLPDGRSRLVVSLDSRVFTAPEQREAPVGAPVPAPAPAAAPAAAQMPKPVAAIPKGRDIVVAIDAGHGGQDPGAIGKSGLQEKDVTLAIAKALAERVNQTPGMRAVLTRNSDRFVVLRDRIDLARAARADLFVSIHADSIANADVAGSSVYVLSDRGATSEAARWLAERENAADLKGGVNLRGKNQPLAKVLMDLSQTASIGSSMEAAESVLTWLDRVGEVRKSRVQQAGFLVLKSPDIPSMLIETAYISNPAEERQLRTASHQQEIAGAILNGLTEYFVAHPPDGSNLAANKGAAAQGRLP